MEATSLSLSLALGISLRAADKKLTLALGLDAHPDLADALSAGRIDEAQAGVIYDHAASAAPGPSDRLVQSVVTDPATSSAGADVLVKELATAAPAVWSIPAHQLRPILTAAVADLAPDTLQLAAEVAARGWHVAHYARKHRPARCLVLHGPDELLAATYAHLDHQARSRAPAAPPKPWTSSASTSPSAPHRRCVRPDPGPEDRARPAQPATPTPRSGAPPAAPGRGHPDQRHRRRPHPARPGQPPRGAAHPTGDVPIPAELARALAHDPEQATWRRILCDPATGTATEVSTGYRPAPRIAQFCTVRDGHTSRFPTSAARTLELDHIQEYNHTAPATGGATTPANLTAAGKRDHQAKTDRILHVTGDANSELTYTTGTGHTYTSRPHQYLEPQTPAPATEKPPDNGDRRTNRAGAG